MIPSFSKQWSNNNLSLLQHDLERKDSPDEKLQMYKVTQISKNFKLKKLRFQQKALELNTDLHRDIFHTITAKLNSNKIKIYQLFKLVKEYDMNLNFETIDNIYRIADINKDYALHYEEYLLMINSEKANKVYAEYAKIQMKEKMRIARLSHDYYKRNEDENSYSKQNILPQTLHGFFFHVAFMICRSDLYNFAVNDSNLTDQRFEAMSNLLKFNLKHDIMQSGEDNYDEELKQKFLSKSRHQYLNKQQKQSSITLKENENLDQTQFNLTEETRIFNSTKDMKGEDNSSMIGISNIQNTHKHGIQSSRSYGSSLSKKSIMKSYQSSKQSKIHNPSQEDEMELLTLIETARYQGQSDAVIEYQQTSSMAEVLDQNSIFQFKLLNQPIPRVQYNLHLPTIPHTFNDQNGIIKKQYILLPSICNQIGGNTDEFSKLKSITSNQEAIQQIINPNPFTKVQKGIDKQNNIPNRQNRQSRVNQQSLRPLLHLDLYNQSQFNSIKQRSGTDRPRYLNQLFNSKDQSITDITDLSMHKLNIIEELQGGKIFRKKNLKMSKPHMVEDKHQKMLRWNQISNFKPKKLNDIQYINKESEILNSSNTRLGEIIKKDSYSQTVGYDSNDNSILQFIKKL